MPITGSSRAEISDARSTYDAVKPPTYAVIRPSLLVSGRTMSRTSVTRSAVSSEAGAVDGTAESRTTSPALVDLRAAVSWTTPSVPGAPAGASPRAGRCRARRRRPPSAHVGQLVLELLGLLLLLLGLLLLGLELVGLRLELGALPLQRGALALEVGRLPLQRVGAGPERGGLPAARRPGRRAPGPAGQRVGLPGSWSACCWSRSAWRLELAGLVGRAGGLPLERGELRFAAAGLLGRGQAACAQPGRSWPAGSHDSASRHACATALVSARSDPLAASGRSQPAARVGPVPLAASASAWRLQRAALGLELALLGLQLLRLRACSAASSRSSSACWAWSWSPCRSRMPAGRAAAPAPLELTPARPRAAPAGSATPAGTSASWTRPSAASASSRGRPASATSPCCTSWCTRRWAWPPGSSWTPTGAARCTRRRSRRRSGRRPVARWSPAGSRRCPPGPSSSEKTGMISGTRSASSEQPATSPGDAVRRRPLGPERPARGRRGRMKAGSASQPIRWPTRPRNAGSRVIAASTAVTTAIAEAIAERGHQRDAGDRQREQGDHDGGAGEDDRAAGGRHRVGDRVADSACRRAAGPDVG